MTIRRNISLSACAVVLGATLIAATAQAQTVVEVAINGEPYIQLLKIGDGDGREWAAVVKLGPGTGKFDRKNDGYPLLFRARTVGGEIPETFFSGDFSIQ